MTKQEFWHLKYGTVVKEMIYGEHYAWQGKVVKREIIDEVAGFIITKAQTYDLKTGCKLLEITFDCGNGEYRYCNTSQDLRNLKIIKEENL